MFWYIVSLEPAEFDDILLGISGEMEGCKMLYDYTKFSWRAMVTLFLGICITLTWNIISVFREQKYEGSGLGPIVVKHTIWLVFCGSIGLLGFSGAEYSRRILKLVKNVRQTLKAEELVQSKGNVKMEKNSRK